MKQADFLISSSDLYQIKSFVQKIGTNPLVRDKSTQFTLPIPSQFVAKRRHLLPSPAPLARGASRLSEQEVSFCGERGIRTPDTVARIHPFQGCAIDHSAISPYLFRDGRVLDKSSTSLRSDETCPQQLSSTLPSHRTGDCEYSTL